MMDATLSKKASQTAQFVDLEPSRFRDELSKRWESVREIQNAVAEQVEQESITSLQGASVAACVAATVYGYDELHIGTIPEALKHLISNGRK